MRRLVMAFAALVVYFVAKPVVGYYLGQPTISRDHLTEINEMVMAVPPNHRAWPLYARVIRQLGRCGVPPLLHEGESAWDLASDDPAWSAVDRYLEAACEPLVLMRLAATKPALGRIYFAECDGDWRAVLPPAHDVPLMFTMMPHVSQLRVLVQVVLHLELPAALRAGDDARVERCLHVLIGVGRQLVLCPFGVESRAGASIVRSACFGLSRVLARNPGLLSIDALERIEGALTEIQITPTCEDVRRVADDLVQRCFTDGPGDGVATGAFKEDLEREGLSDREGVFGFSFHRAGRAATAAKFVEYFDLVDRYIAGNASLDEVHAWVRSTRTDAFASRYAVVRWQLPDIVERVREANLALMVRDAAVVALASEVYRRQTGDHPASMVPLAPGWMERIPPDRAAGGLATLRLETRAGHVSVFSDGLLGTNRDPRQFGNEQRLACMKPDTRLWPIGK